VSKLRANGVGVALQAADLVETLTVLENVALPGITLHEPDVWERAHAALLSLGVDHLAESLPGQLSTGERRRAALARVLCAGRAFVLVDEPTAHLDSASTEMVTEALRRAAERGACILVVSHDRHFAASADRSFEMVSGRLKDSQ
jgi:ABC-type lipoprotein export system ATPase subunit